MCLQIIFLIYMYKATQLTNENKAKSEKWYYHQSKPNNAIRNAWKQK